MLSTCTASIYTLSYRSRIKTYHGSSARHDGGSHRGSLLHLHLTSRASSPRAGNGKYLRSGVTSTATDVLSSRGGYSSFGRWMHFLYHQRTQELAAIVACFPAFNSFKPPYAPPLQVPPQTLRHLPPSLFRVVKNLLPDFAENKAFFPLKPSRLRLLACKTRHSHSPDLPEQRPLA